MTHILKVDKDLTIGFARACISDGWKHPRSGHAFPEYTVHDELWATALVVCGAAKPVAAFVSLDLCVIRTPAMTEIRSLVAASTGIPSERLALHCTHTHASYSGDSVDPAFLAARIAEAIGTAAAAAKPATVAHAHRELGPGYDFNRRVHLSDGLGAHCVMFNTDCRTENGRVEASGQLRKVVRNWETTWDDLEMSKRETWTDGPIDSHLHVVSFRDASGGTLGSIVRFAGHPVIVSRHWIGHELSRDAVGYVADVVARATAAPCLYLTGPSGNQRLYCEEYTHAEAKKRGEIIGDEAMKLFGDLAFAPLDRLTLATDAVGLDLWDGFPKDRDEQQRLFAEAEAAVKAVVDAKRPPAEIKKLDEQRTRVRFAGQMFDRGVLTCEDAAAATFRQPITAIDFGPAAMATFPCEPFMEVSERVRSAVGGNVITAQLTNGAHGYVPTAEAWQLGGYETTWCSTAPDAAERYVRAATALIDAARRA